jgi:tRNA 2-thiouridine synthesizing protein A
MKMQNQNAENICSDKVLDTYGLLCPIPIVKTAQMVKTLPPGTVLEVISSDAAIEADLRNWCKSHRHQYLGCRRHGRAFHVFLRV